MVDLLQVRGLRVSFDGPRRGVGPFARRSVVRAVDGVDFDIGAGRTLGLVGESGCGKSTLGRALLKLCPASAGSVRFEGQSLFELGNEALRAVRERLQIIFQDPYASLDPRRSIGYQIGEPLLLGGMADAPRARRVRELLGLVGLEPEHADRYPHEFSGGQRQRVGIARALATGPSLVVADEPVSALDVSVQAQVINLLRRLRAEMQLSMLFISHDLRVVRYLSDDVAVMYLGRIVEIAPVDRLFDDPRHPYTRALLSAVPRARWDGTAAEVIRLEGEVPSPLDLPGGCRFSSRCPFARELCLESDPSLESLAPEHRVACHLVNEHRDGAADIGARAPVA